MTFKKFKSFKSINPPPSSSSARRGRKEVAVERSVAVERFEPFALGTCIRRDCQTRLHAPCRLPSSLSGCPRQRSEIRGLDMFVGEEVFTVAFADDSAAFKDVCALDQFQHGVDILLDDQQAQAIPV